MSKCSICNTEAKVIGEYELRIGSNTSIIPKYNIQILTHVGGKDICNDCMDKYYKIDALYRQRDFSCGGVEYYADGRNLK